jgi:hypothetical protein
VVGEDVGPGASQVSERDVQTSSDDDTHHDRDDLP